MIEGHSQPPVVQWIAGGIIALLTLTIPVGCVMIESSQTTYSLNNKEIVKDWATLAPLR